VLTARVYPVVIAMPGGKIKPEPETLPAPEPRPPFFDRRKLLARRAEPDARGLLAGMRIRKKLVFLHTLFSIALAAILLVALRPALNEVVVRAEVDQCRRLLDVVAPSLESGGVRVRDPGLQSLIENLPIQSGKPEEIGVSSSSAAEAMATPLRAVATLLPGGVTGAVVYVPGQGDAVGAFHALAVRIEDARRAVTRLYVFVVGALLGVYALVALALEVFVLPRAVYAPIRRMLEADRAVQEGRLDRELIPREAIPADELGQIMSSRNESIEKLRRHEAALADALSRLETVANDLRRKNHLLQTTQRTLADAERLASLGMMSAGIAHELNTPLAVLKGLVEKLNTDPRAGMDPAQAALMLRVVTRLERLGDSLLDFARVRPPASRPTVLRTCVAEAVTLVRLDREGAGVEVRNSLSEEMVVECDPDRLIQVFVNLIRNAVDAIRIGGGGGGLVAIEADAFERDGQRWVSVRIIDDGPGIDAAILPRLFEPFASTRLDARGTGLGLAVAEGIVREHAGVLLARNRTDRSGAIFEILLPCHPVRAGGDESPIESTSTPATLP